MSIFFLKYMRFRIKRVVIFIDLNRRTMCSNTLNFSSTIVKKKKIIKLELFNEEKNMF